MTLPPPIDASPIVTACMFWISNRSFFCQTFSFHHFGGGSSWFQTLNQVCLVSHLCEFQSGLLTFFAGEVYLVSDFLYISSLDDFFEWQIVILNLALWRLLMMSLTVEAVKKNPDVTMYVKYLNCSKYFQFKCKVIYK